MKLTEKKIDLKNKENCIFDNIFILLSSDKIILSS